MRAILGDPSLTRPGELSQFISFPRHGANLGLPSFAVGRGTAQLVGLGWVSDPPVTRLD